MNIPVKKKKMTNLYFMRNEDDFLYSDDDSAEVLYYEVSYM